MTRWENQIVTVRGDLSANTVVNVLNQLGQQGWEAWHAHPMQLNTPNGPVNAMAIYLKKEGVLVLPRNNMPAAPFRG